MKRSFLDKIIISYLLIGIFCFIAVFIFTNKNINRIFITERTKSLQSQAKLIATQYVKSHYDGELDNFELSKELQRIESFLGTEIWITNYKGQFIASSREDYQLPATIYDIAPDMLLSTSFTVTGDFHGSFSDEVISVGIPIYEHDVLKGYIILHSSLQDLSTTQTNVLHTAYLAFLVFILFSLLLFYHFSRNILIPLSKINETAYEYRNGNFDHVIEVTDRYEIGTLADSLNEMADELRKMETYRRDFLANVSHDFRSPLTSIKGYVEAMLDGTIPYEMQEKYLNIVLNETQRLTKLTSGILDLKNFDSNSLILKKKIFDINEMIVSIADVFEGTAQQRKVTISLDISSQPVKVYADPDKIKQVIYNLVDNAIKFSPENTTVFITALVQNSDKVKISVKDKGIGISDSEQKHIWERFYKADTSRGKDKTGTGLGLSIVKEIIKAHEEQIELVSTKGNGCDFAFTLTRAN